MVLLGAFFWPVLLVLERRSAVALSACGIRGRWYTTVCMPVELRGPFDESGSKWTKSKFIFTLDDQSYGVAKTNFRVFRWELRG